MIIDWILDKLGYNFQQKQKILKIIWKVMAVVFGVAMLYGVVKMLPVPRLDDDPTASLNGP